MSLYSPKGTLTEINMKNSYMLSGKLTIIYTINPNFSLMLNSNFFNGKKVNW